MSRDQRVKDNWALLHACEVAAKTGAPVAICFNLVRLCPAQQCLYGPLTLPLLSSQAHDVIQPVCYEVDMAQHHTQPTHVPVCVCYMTSK